MYRYHYDINLGLWSIGSESILNIDTLCPDPVQPGPKLSHNLEMLIPSEPLVEQLTWTPFEKEMFKAVNALVKAAASRNKRSLKEDGDDFEGEDDRPKKAKRSWLTSSLSTMYYANTA